MFRDQSRLRDQIVFLEVADNHHIGMNAKLYRAAARSVREIMVRELGGLRMEEFAIADLPTLQTTAENIYFESHGRFADLDGSGRADTAHALARQLIERVTSQA